VTSATAEVEPACPGGPTEAPTPGPTAADPRLVALRRPIDAIDRATWDALAARNPWATPFARWAFHRAWWDGYGRGATDETIVVVDPSAGPEAPPVAIVPLMRRTGGPSEAASHTSLRHESPLQLPPIPRDGEPIAFGASYHADYATLLAAPADLDAVAKAVAGHARSSGAADGGDPWSVLDLRRLRCGDPVADALASAFTDVDGGRAWTAELDREDVCPIVTIAAGATGLDDVLATLGKKERHEIRRKLRRAEAVGPVALVESVDPLTDLEVFIDLHQRKWGARGLFPPTPGGDASRVFVRRLFETFGPGGPVHLCFLTVAGRRIAAGITFEEGDTIGYYNAGVDPDARDLSPGVLLIARYVERAIETGRRRLDFLRGDEAYKYEWGAVDEPIQRLLIRRVGA